ncbi:MAG: hypothetical protein QOI64_1715 [Solirubrobacteraceae bacterium]|nr:hypothetical protein [Solirubrobacteraceae bacterium]
MLVRIRSELDDRIAALRPVAEEFGRLQLAVDALDEAANDGASASPATVPATPAPAPAGVRAKPAGPRRRRATRSGTARAAPGQTQQRVIEQLHSGPGSTSTVVAAALGISANAAAATISRLVKQGRVRRLDTGGYAASAAPADAVPSAPAPAAPATDADRQR